MRRQRATLMSGSVEFVAKMGLDEPEHPDCRPLETRLPRSSDRFIVGVTPMVIWGSYRR